MYSVVSFNALNIFQNMILESQQTPHTSPSPASYEVSFAKIVEKTVCVITTPHCTCNRHPITQPKGQCIGCLSPVPSTVCVLLQSLHCYVQCCIKFDDGNILSC